MKGSLAVLAALLSADVAFAFAPLRSSSSRACSSSPTAINGAPISPERIKKAGGGIPLDPPGSKNLFDPATDGKLKGTGACDDRISSAYQYEYLAPVPPPTVPDQLDKAQHWLENIGTPPPAFAKATQPAAARVLGRARKCLSVLMNVLGRFDCNLRASLMRVWSVTTSTVIFSSLFADKMQV